MKQRYYFVLILFCLISNISAMQDLKADKEQLCKAIKEIDGPAVLEMCKRGIRLDAKELIEYFDRIVGNPSAVDFEGPFKLFSRKKNLPIFQRQYGRLILTKLIIEYYCYADRNPKYACEISKEYVIIDKKYGLTMGISGSIDTYFSKLHTNLLKITDQTNIESYCTNKLKIVEHSLSKLDVFNLHCQSESQVLLPAICKPLENDLYPVIGSSTLEDWYAGCISKAILNQDIPFIVNILNNTNGLSVELLIQLIESSLGDYGLDDVRSKLLAWVIARNNFTPKHVYSGKSLATVITNVFKEKKKLNHYPYVTSLKYAERLYKFALEKGEGHTDGEQVTLFLEHMIYCAVYGEYTSQIFERHKHIEIRRAEKIEVSIIQDQPATVENKQDLPVSESKMPQGTIIPSVDALAAQPLLDQSQKEPIPEIAIVNNIRVNHYYSVFTKYGIWIIAAGAGIGLIALVVQFYKLKYIEKMMIDLSRWMNWDGQPLKEHISLEQFKAMEADVFIDILLKGIFDKYKDAEYIEDATNDKTFAKFLEDVDYEIEQLQRYTSKADKITQLHLGFLMGTHKPLIEEARQKLEKLKFIRKKFIKWAIKRTITREMPALIQLMPA